MNTLKRFLNELLEDLFKIRRKYSIGRILTALTFLYSSFYWLVLRIDVPSTLMGALTLFAGYTLAGKFVPTEVVNTSSLNTKIE